MSSRAKAEREHAHRVAREWMADPAPGTLARVIERERRLARREALIEAMLAECGGCRWPNQRSHMCWAKRTRVLLEDMERGE